MLVSSKDLYEKLSDLIRHNDMQNVEDIISKNSIGINDNIYDKKTILHICIEQKNDEIAKDILNTKDVSVNICDKNNETALHLAIKYGSYKLILDLINKGANLNIENCSGKTPLILALELNRKDVAELLIRKGADYTLGYVRSDGKCKYDVLNVAFLNGHSEIVDLIGKINNFTDEKLNEYKNTLANILYNKLEWKYSKDTIKKYLNIKLGIKDININPDMINEVIGIYREYNNKYHVDTKNMRVDDESKDIEKSIQESPIMIRGIRNIIGTEFDMRHNETGAETEIRKLLRKKGYKTISRLSCDKNGNLKRCFSVIQYGKIRPLIGVGYGIFGLNFDKVHYVSDVDLASRINNREDTIEIGPCFGPKRTLNCIKQENAKKFEELYSGLKDNTRIAGNNEIIMDVEQNDVDFIFYEQSAIAKELKAIYLRRIFKQKTGRVLPILRYNIGNEKYLEEVNINKEDVLNILKQDVIELDAYETPRFAKVLLAFKDELNEIPSFKGYLDNLFEKFKKEKFSLYDVANVSELAKEFSVNEEKTAFIKDKLKDILDLNANIILKNVKQRLYEKARKNREIDFWFEAISQLDDNLLENEDIREMIIAKTYDVCKLTRNENELKRENWKMLTKNFILKEEKMKEILREI